MFCVVLVCAGCVCVCVFGGPLPSHWLFVLPCYFRVVVCFFGGFFLLQLSWWLVPTKVRSGSPDVTGLAKRGLGREKWRYGDEKNTGLLCMYVFGDISEILVPRGQNGIGR